MVEEAEEVVEVVVASRKGMEEEEGRCLENRVERPR